MFRFNGIMWAAATFNAAQKSLETVVCQSPKLQRILGSERKISEERLI
jgi:hypothetical protein